MRQNGAQVANDLPALGWREARVIGRHALTRDAIGEQPVEVAVCVSLAGGGGQ